MHVCGEEHQLLRIFRWSSALDFGWIQVLCWNLMKVRPRKSKAEMSRWKKLSSWRHPFPRGPSIKSSLWYSKRHYRFLARVKRRCKVSDQLSKHTIVNLFCQDRRIWDWLMNSFACDRLLLGWSSLVHRWRALSTVCPKECEKQ